MFVHLFTNVLVWRAPVKDNEHLVSMHPMIPGESVLFLGETREGVISLSNFRYVTDQIIIILKMQSK